MSELSKSYSWRRRIIPVALAMITGWLASEVIPLSGIAKAVVVGVVAGVVMAVMLMLIRPNRTA